MLTRKDLRIVIIEARLDQAMIDHEHHCIVRAGKLAPEQVVPVSILPDGPDVSILDQYHAVILGGTGDYSVVEDHLKFYEPLLSFTRLCLERGIPTLGLCYGHQIMAQALGGVVKTVHELEETGTYEMVLTPEGRRDPLLADLPDRFPAQQGHHDAVQSMPAEFLRLAYSERCQWQGMKHRDKPFYGFQFHPELTRDDLVQRMNTYAHVYASQPGKLESIIASIKFTDNQSVIANFIDKAVMPTLR